jgi:hypothetical protein
MGAKWIVRLSALVRQHSFERWTVAARELQLDVLGNVRPPLSYYRHFIIQALWQEKYVLTHLSDGLDHPCAYSDHESAYSGHEKKCRLQFASLFQV